MKLSKKVIIIIAAVLVLLIGGGITVAMNTPNARAERQLNLGNKYLQEGKYQEAILAFQKVIQIEPKNIPARLGLGNAYIATNEYDKAETVLKEVIEIDPNNIPAREELFQVYVKEGNKDAANGMLKEIASLDPNIDLKQYNSDLDLAQAISVSKANYVQGIKQMNDKQYLEAIDSFQKVIKEDSERYDDAQTKINDCKVVFVDATLQKAKEAAANKDYQTALDLVEQLLKVDPSNQEALKLKSDYTSSLEKEKKISDSNAQGVKRFIEDGIIPNSQFQFGTPAKTILDILGEPKSKGSYEGSSYYAYGDITYFVDIYESKLISVALLNGELFGIKIGKTILKDVPNIIGIPAELGESRDNGWIVSYHSKYKLFFVANSPNESVTGIQFLNHP